MAPKIFLTGGTGYIGGSVLNTIVTNHPEYDVTVLLRKNPEGFATRYPDVKVVNGNYDSFDVLADSASRADLVIHNGNSDHEPSLNALITGLLRRPTPGFLIHLSGTGIVSDYHDPMCLGKLNPKIWSDLKDLPEISSLPNNALHRNTEKLLNDAVAKYGDKINIAIVCPPDIYGKGKGLARTQSALIPMFIDEAKKLPGGRVFYYGEGANTRSWVHIDDLMVLYLKLVEAALVGGGNATWGKEGYYFAATQELSHIDVAMAAGKILKKIGVVESDEPLQVSLQQLDSMVELPGFPKLARYLYASNSRTRSDRAKRLFGYEGKSPSLWETLEKDILDAVGRH